MDKREPNIKKEFTLGFSALAVNTVVLYAGVFLFSILYKAGAKSAQFISADGPAWISEQTFFVRPALALLGIFLLFALKNLYDVRFYHIQRQARDDHAKLKRVAEWILYVLVTVLLIALIFLCFSCGENFFDTYTFESAGLGNAAYSLLYFVIPLLYAIHAIVRVILKKAGVWTEEAKPQTRAQRRRQERDRAKKSGKK
ncbi:MAG: hypothetical protein NC409_09835 [Clostridium sp.]|nr:hypothetical protein [Clostridium sp.]